MEIEWLILADSAQVVGNKLYLLGGGWDILSIRQKLPFNQPCGIALAVKVPWNNTNEKHNFEIEFVSEDQETEEPHSMAKFGGQLEVGRPPGIQRGHDQRVQLAVNIGLQITSAGTKIVVARIDGTELKRITFNVITGT